jgi:putative phage-type endonuclease
MITSEQRAERINYIGGSDSAAILGLSRWKTPLQVWAEKAEIVMPEIKENIAMRLGNRLEEIVCEMFAEETGKTIFEATDTITHPQYPFIRANIDRRIDGENAILEVKTASAYKSREWDDDQIPIEYVIQCLHYLAVTGADRCYVAVLIGNQKFIWKTIEADKKVQDDLIRREVKFWNEFVIPKAMPSVRAGDADTLSDMYPIANPVEIHLTDDANIIMENLEALKADLMDIKDKIELSENELKALLGQADTGLTSRYKIQWSNRKSRRLDTTLFKKDMPEIYNKYSKDSHSRVFTYKKLGGE